MPESSFATPGIVAPPPEWVVPTFNAGDYTANGSMTWAVESGDANVAYLLNGKTMTLSIRLATTVIGGTGNTTLYVKIPAGKTAKRLMGTTIYLLLPGPIYEAGTLQAVVDDTKIHIGRLAGGNFPTGSNVYMWGQITFEIK